MPYINRVDRAQYQTQLNRLTAFILADVIETIRSVDQEEQMLVGNKLRYSYLHHIVNGLVNKVWGTLSTRRYVDHQDVTGFLTCAAFEYNRKYTKKQIGLITPPEVSPTLKYGAQIEELLNEAATLIPKDHMLRSGHMNYFISYLIDSIFGDVSSRTDEHHSYIETLLHTVAKEYYDTYTAPYEDVKIAEQGDLRDL